MNATTLKNTSAVFDLASLQHERGIPDADFARVCRLGLSGSSWGKIKAGTFPGNAEAAQKKVAAALAFLLSGNAAFPSENGIVVLPHVADLASAVAIARTAKDEHRLAVICGPHGSGKSTALEYVRRQFGGTIIHALPGWQRSYFYFLCAFARGLGMNGDFRGIAQAEPAILARLTESPQLILIDEGNHFNRDSLNFLKSILNQTPSAIVLATLPPDLARMAAENASETRQLLRRAVAICHIGLISSEFVAAIHAALFPAAPITGWPVKIANLANRKDYLDTVCEVLRIASEDGDTEAAIAAVESAKLPALQSRRVA
jgi:DNA transposition AAA+ family ATPase